jgi:hypothetical protein
MWETYTFGALYFVSWWLEGVEKAVEVKANDLPASEQKWFRAKRVLEKSVHLVYSRQRLCCGRDSALDACGVKVGRLSYIWKYVKQHKDLRGRFWETYELSSLAKSLPKCDICGKEYVPVPDPPEPLPFLVKPEELGWEMAIKRGDKIVRVARYHLKCDVETLEDPAVRAKVAREASEVLRKMGFNPKEVSWLK